MTNSKKHWGVVGGGILGMQIANRLLKAGHEVTLLEAEDTLGGLTNTWKLDQITWDKYYHVILLSDMILRNLLEEIGLSDQLKWVETKSGFYTDRKLYSMSNSVEFLQFPPLSLIDKFRLGFTIFYASKVKDWKRLEQTPVSDWLQRLSGKNTFEKIWLPLLRAKLGENYKHTSAAFIWSTIQRMYAARRTGLKKEMFGYVEGGYAKILQTFTEHLLENGAQIKTGFRVKNIKKVNSSFKITCTQEQVEAFDRLVVTVPSSVIPFICEDLSEEEIAKHRQIEYLGVICASVLLKKSISPYYVTNITDPTPFTGIIEMTNMVDRTSFEGNALVYLPKYVKKTDEIFSWDNEKIKTHFADTLVNMYDHIQADDIVAIQVAKAANVFALSTIGYSQKLPPIESSVPGLYLLNSAHIVNGTLNVNETLQLVDKALPTILETAKNV